MGNTPSNVQEQAPKETSAPFTSHQLLRKVIDPHYGEIKLVRDNRTGEQFFLKEIKFSSKEEFQNEVNFYNKRIAVSHPNIVRIVGCNTQDQLNFYASYYRISVFIEVLHKTLEEELDARTQTGIPFSENDILLVAENLIAGLSYFEAQNISHGDLRPANIFVLNHSYKLSDPYLNISKTSNALSNAILGTARTLLSPQLLLQVPQQDLRMRCNKFKADVFSLGMTLLSLASLSLSEDLYDYDNGILNIPLMRERLEIVRKSYSKFTYELIRDMIRIKEDARPDFISFSNRLRPHQEDIRRKAELPFFSLQAPPEKNQDDEDNYIFDLYAHKLKPTPPTFDNKPKTKPIVAKNEAKIEKKAPGQYVNKKEEPEPIVGNVYNCDSEEDVYDYGRGESEGSGREEIIEGQSEIPHQTDEEPYEEIELQSSSMEDKSLQLEVEKPSLDQIIPSQPKLEPEAVLQSRQGPQPAVQKPVQTRPDARLPPHPPGSASKYQNKQATSPRQPNFEAFQRPIFQAKPQYEAPKAQFQQSPVKQQPQTFGIPSLPIIQKSINFPQSPKTQKITIPINTLSPTQVNIPVPITPVAQNQVSAPVYDDLEAKIQAALRRSQSTYTNAVKLSTETGLSPMKTASSQLLTQPSENKPLDLLSYKSPTRSAGLTEVSVNSFNVPKVQSTYEKSNFEKGDGLSDLAAAFNALTSNPHSGNKGQQNLSGGEFFGYPAAESNTIYYNATAKPESQGYYPSQYGGQSTGKVLYNSSTAPATTQGYPISIGGAGKQNEEKIYNYGKIYGLGNENAEDNGYNYDGSTEGRVIRKHGQTIILSE